MVWVHGGAYILGSSAQPLYHGGALAGGGEAVIVTLNYRLGALGFLDLSSFGGRVRHQPRPARRAVRAAVGARQHRRIRGRPEPGHIVRRIGGRGHRHHAAGQPRRVGTVLTRRSRRARRPPRSTTAIAPAGVAELFLEALGVGTDDVNRLPAVPVDAILAASKRVFDDVPVRTPGTLAFAPIIDGDVVPAHPVKLAREGRTHPVPLIIGTNKHEAALFRWMKSPLMPITPQAIRAMFAEIAAEQPGLQLPSEAQIRCRLPRAAARPSAWAWPATSGSGCRRSGSPRAIATSRRCTCTASTSPRRCCACCGWAPHMPPSCRSCGAIWSPGSKDPTFKLGGLKAGKTVSARIRARWLNFAVDGAPTGPAGDPKWRPYLAEDRATLLIDAQDRVIDDPDRDLRAAWGDEVLSFRISRKLSPREVLTWTDSRVARRAAAADARSGDLRHSLLPHPSDHRVDQRGKAGARRGGARARGLLSAAATHGPASRWAWCRSRQAACSTPSP